MSYQYNHKILNPYRFGFNGQERETELNTSITSAEFWMYDGRIIRRWNTDPVYNAYESRYSTFGNNPIFYADPNGDYKTKFGARMANLFRKGDVIKAQHGKRAGEWYFSKKTNNGVDEDGNAIIRTGKPEYGGKAFKKVEETSMNAIKNLERTASSAVTVGSTLIMPIINQIYVISKEGIHEGDAYHRENNLSWATICKIEDFRFVKLEENNETSKEVFKATINMAINRIPLKVPKKLTEPLLKNITSEKVRKFTEKRINDFAKSKIRNKSIDIINTKIDNEF